MTNVVHLASTLLTFPSCQAIFHQHHRDSRKMKMNMKGYALIAAIGVMWTPAAATGRSSEGPRPVGQRRERSERKKRRRK